METTQRQFGTLRVLLATLVLVCQGTGALLLAPSIVQAASSASSVEAQAEKDPVLTREQYVAEVEGLKPSARKKIDSGEPPAAVAKDVDQKRRELNSRYYSTLPESKRMTIEAENEKKYGNKQGPDIEYFRKKGSSWEQIIESASKVSSKI